MEVLGLMRPRKAQRHSIHNAQAHRERSESGAFDGLGYGQRGVRSICTSLEKMTFQEHDGEKAICNKGIQKCRTIYSDEIKKKEN